MTNKKLISNTLKNFLMFYLLLIVFMTIFLAGHSLMLWSTYPFIEFFQFVGSLELHDSKILILVLMGCVVMAITEPNFWDK